MKTTYQTQNVCSREILVETEDGKIRNVEFLGGCNGNLKGIAKLVRGMEIDEVIRRLEGTTCGHKETSCPDQLCKALRRLKEDAPQKETR